MQKTLKYKFKETKRLNDYIETYLQKSTRSPSLYSIQENLKKINLHEYTSPIFIRLPSNLMEFIPLIQCLSLIPCLIRAKDLYVLKNTFVLNTVVHCDLYAQRFIVTSAEKCICPFLNRFNKCTSILKAGYQDSVIDLCILRNETPTYSIYWAK